MGFNEPVTYQSCPTHKKKLTNLECETCQEKVKNPVEDFSVELYVESEDNVFKFTLYKRQISFFDTTEKNDNLVQKLEEIDGKSCIIDYDKKDNDCDEQVDKVYIVKKISIV